MIRFLIISFLLSFIFTSCSLKTTEGLRLINGNITEIENPYFSNPDSDYVYKAKIKIYGKNLGGILIIKKLGPEIHRIVFTTEFGNKIFDFQFEEGTFTKNFVIEDLDRKFIINVLKNDFELLVKENAKLLALYEGKNQIIYKTQSDKGFNFYFFNDNSAILEKIVNTSKTKEKVEIIYTSSESSIADNIEIKHSNIKLRIDLEKFKKE